MTTVTAPTFEEVLVSVQALAARWEPQLGERQRRTTLDPRDFDDLRAAGVHLSAVPVELGGLWAGVVRSTRPVCEMFRTLATVDPSVALAAVMHPSALQSVLSARSGPGEEGAWKEQRQWIFQSVLDGCWWGPLGSEPGKASDRDPVRATARLDPDGCYRLSGRFHFATGGPIMSYRTTSAVPEGEQSAASFIVEMRGVPLDGSAGVHLTARWDGHGMAATESHAYEFQDFPAVRLDLPTTATRAVGSPFFIVAYTAVVLGVVETAVRHAARELKGRPELVPFEQTEWSEATVNAWLMRQAYEGMLRAIESRRPTLGAEIFQGKIACGQLAETAMAQICRVVGARTFSRSSSFGNWFEDVRALGFLRPSWRLAYYDLLGFLVGETNRRTNRDQAG